MAVSTGLPYSVYYEAGDLVFISGQLPLREDGTMPESVAEQTAVTLNNIKSILNSIGLDMDDVVKTQVMMVEFDRFGEMNAEYQKHFTVFPARTAMGVSALPKGAGLEIDVIAKKR